MVRTPTKNQDESLNNESNVGAESYEDYISKVFEDKKAF
jgi:hypothetical protein